MDFCILQSAKLIPCLEGIDSYPVYNERIRSLVAKPKDKPGRSSKHLHMSNLRIHLYTSAARILHRRVCCTKGPFGFSARLSCRSFPPKGEVHVLKRYQNLQDPKEQSGLKGWI